MSMEEQHCPDVTEAQGTLHRRTHTHTHGWVALGTIPGAGMLQEFLGLSGFASRDLLPLTPTGKTPSSKRGLKK